MRKVPYSTYVCVLAGVGCGLALATPSVHARPRRIKIPTSGVSKTPTPGPAAKSETSCTWKTSDIIDPRIDIGAQKSLMSKMSRGTPKSLDASAMLGAIKSGALAGIFLPPRKAVSDRGKRMTPPQGYWTMIPKGKDSVCLGQPADEAPMIIYRENLSTDRIDRALSDAWAQCGLPTPSPACGYDVDLTRPECVNDQECVDKDLGNVCIDHTCENDVPAKIKPPKPKAKQKQPPVHTCDPQLEARLRASCNKTQDGEEFRCTQASDGAISRCSTAGPLAIVCETKAMQAHFDCLQRAKAKSKRCAAEAKKTSQCD